MDTSSRSTPPSLKSQPRLRSRPVPHLSCPFDDPADSPSLSSPSLKKSPCPPNITIHELLLLPSSPQPLPTESIPRRKGKSRSTATISPRNVRRARRRLDKDITRVEKQLGPVEEDAAKARKRRQTRSLPARKEKANLAPLLPSSESLNIIGDDQSSLDCLSNAVLDLVMWKNTAKSCLWFGLGSIIFLSFIFSGDVEFSIISAFSHLGLLMLVFAFFHDLITHRNQEKNLEDVLRLTEEDVLRVARVIVPVVSAALAVGKKFFSGEPLMTLKVAPFLLLLANYGHLITLWRLLAIGFFLVFTVPKLCFCYYQQIQQRAEAARSYVSETWKSCSRKKLVAASAVALLWNIMNVKMRFFAAFITVVVLRYYHQRHYIPEDANIDKESVVWEQYQQPWEEGIQSCEEGQTGGMEIENLITQK